MAFVGGSLVDAGGHNMLEPAKWQSPFCSVLHGQFQKHRRRHEAQAGAAIEVPAAMSWLPRWAGCLVMRRNIAKMGKRGAQVAHGSGSASYESAIGQRYL